MEYLSLNTYLNKTFGCKVYKLAINGGFTCPNRDGKIGTRGCIFCSGYGSGDFATSAALSITEQIEEAKSKVSGKIKDGKYIAYFQAFTNTYGPLDTLRAKFTEAINHPDIVAISVGTRPDCLPEDILNVLSELNKIKSVWVELGLQTIHEQSADFIRRGYKLDVYDKAVQDLKARGIYVITHVILGIPGETQDMMLDTVKYVCNNRTDGIKLQLLHYIEGTDLGELYKFKHSGNDLEYFNSYNKDDSTIFSDTTDFIGYYIRNYNSIVSDIRALELDEYARLIRKCVEIIPKDIAIHRLTGDGDKKTLIAPLWSGDKKRVLNTINRSLSCK